ncbi:peptide-methionine (S)-S-oxide reductase [Marinigracilibium pacificum]|uniref:peptide-methionine (S)-S-oxide reductase n=1 Tax=Marinigracilibium pacificum TaxID=2729599 RepID=A0A848IUG8_9BACT|nr:peptide-methionine (S)-S-oxide reductase [Marinigracilibium pacificum]NMM47356.1 peptide methionine sulfoxide reductase [Marinigracilibium pacificum]
MELGLGGGCHWCTEAIFQSLKGVEVVKQGWIASIAPNEAYSEGIYLRFDENNITLREVIYIHLITHSSSSKHSLRNRYRSAIYYFSKDDKSQCEYILSQIKADLNKTIITETLPFKEFKTNKPEQLNYFKTKPTAPFCKTYIIPKLQTIFEFDESLLREEIKKILGK